jgi:hypothetical protein
MKISLAGGSKQQYSLPFNSERTVNLYPIVDESGSDAASLYNTAGLALFGTAGLGAIRGCFSAGNNRAFVVSGSELYEVLANGTSIPRGSLLGSSGIVTMAENGVQLAVCDGDKVYIFTFATNVFAIVTDPDLPSVGAIDYIDSYFVVNENNTGRFYISALLNGLSWDALDFATAESSPDKLNRAVNFLGYIGLFGDKTLEIWRNTGDSLFPFAKVSSSTPIGCISPYTILSVDTSVYWVGANEQGYGIVYQAQGFTPKRISTEPIEKLLQAVSQPELLRSWSYQEQGHVFYAITGSDLETTLVFDLNTQIWHERAWLNPQGEFEQHRGSCVMRAFNKTLVGDRETGDIYEMSLDYYTDVDDYIKRVRVTTHLLDEMKRIRYNSLTIGFETGVGLQSGQGSEPLINLRISQDGARTWSNLYSKSIGAVGKYQQEVTFRRLGISQQNTFEISTSEPCKIVLTGAYLNS